MQTEKEKFLLAQSSGTVDVTYWSVYRQQWITSLPSEIPDEEYAAMPKEQREDALALLKRAGITREEMEE